MLNIQRGLWTYNFFPDIFILSGQNDENIMREIFLHHRIAIVGLRRAWIKKLKKKTHFFPKMMNVCFLQLFDSSTPKASNRDMTTRKYYKCKFFMIWAPSNQNIWQEFMGPITIGIDNYIGFWNAIKLNIGLKIGT